MSESTISYMIDSGQSVTTRGRSGDTARGLVTLHVLGKFELLVGSRSIPVGVACQRLLALLAINGGQVTRCHAAGVLWPEVRAARAGANLRSVLWRLQQCCGEVIEPSYQDLRLAMGVAVDIEEVSSVARRLLARSVPMDVAELQHAVTCNLYEDVAPDLGDDDWLAVERERFRQFRVHSLEALAGDLINAGWYGAAIESAMGAVRADPFRESAHYLLVKAHLAEGNQFEARRQYLTYCGLMRNELGVEPSEQFRLLFDENGAQLPSQNPRPTGRGAQGNNPALGWRSAPTSGIAIGGRMNRRSDPSAR